MTDIYGRSNDVFPSGVNTNNLTALDETANINLGGGEINLDAAVVLINGAPISGVGGFVVNPMAIDLNANEYSITNAGSVQAAVFVKAGGTNQQYLMADGSSLQYSQNSGNSNFYLYDNGVDQNPTPPSGVVTYNTVEQKQATEIYISHRTRDNIDIEVFFTNISTLNTVYLQDQSDSANNITYDIIGPPVIVNQAQITIPVAQTSSNGTGSTSFGNGHNILVSFFTNSIETDLRITSLEGKTQNINASLIGTDFSNNSSFILDPASSHTFTIRNNATPFSTAKFTVSNTSVQVISVPLLMNLQRITLLAAPVDPNDAARKVYVDDANALKLDKVPSLIQQGGLKWAKVNAAVTQGSAVGTFDLIGTPLSTAIVGSTTFAANEITPFSTYVITVGGRITLPSNSQCTLAVTMNGAVVDPLSFGNNPNISGGGFECKFTWTFRAGGVLSSSIIHNIGSGSQNTTANQGGGGTVTINTAIQQVMGVQFASPTFATPNITTYTITCVKL
jgi:hypothetical protein